MAAAHQVQINHHLERAEILNEYLNELNKPGFKQERSYIITGTTQRAELFVTAASNSYQGDGLLFPIDKTRKIL